MTFFYKIDGKEYDAGVAIRGYDNYYVGDSIEVYYIKNQKYAAQKNRKIYSYSGFFTLEKIGIILGIILLILAPFFKEKSNRVNKINSANLIGKRTKKSMLQIWIHISIFILKTLNLLAD